MFIFHIIKKDDWEVAQKNGELHPESLDREGFIHFSHTDQILYVANNLYKGQEGLVLLKVDARHLENKLVEEPPLEAPQSGLMFPHYYAPLETKYVSQVFDFPADNHGQFQLPSDLLG